MGLKQWRLTQGRLPKRAAQGAHRAKITSSTPYHPTPMIIVPPLPKFNWDIWKGDNPEHWRKHRDSRLAKPRTVCELADEQWLELSMAGTSSSADRPFEAQI